MGHMVRKIHQKDAEIRCIQEIFQEPKRIAPTSIGETGMKRILKKNQRTKERAGSHD